MLPIKVNFFIIKHLYPTGRRVYQLLPSFFLRREIPPPFSLISLLLKPFVQGFPDYFRFLMSCFIGAFAEAFRKREGKIE